MVRPLSFRRPPLETIRIITLITITMLMPPLILGNARAHDGFSVGVTTSVSPDGNAAANLLVSYPIATFDVSAEEVLLAVRSNIGYSITNPALPSFGVAAVASSVVSDEVPDAETYLGAGFGISFTPNPLGAPYAFGGGRIGVASALHAIWEIHVAAASGTITPSIAIGIEYSFGGSR